MGSGSSTLREAAGMVACQGSAGAAVSVAVVGAAEAASKAGGHRGQGQGKRGGTGSTQCNGITGPS